MKKFILFALALVLNASLSEAQENQAPASLWTHGGNLKLHLSQSHFSNWSAGGTDAFNWISGIDYNLNYQNGDTKWNNNFTTSLGYSHFDLEKAAIKNDDKLIFTSLYGCKASETFYYSVELSFKSQLNKGYKYSSDSVDYVQPTSDFLAPAYTTLGIGIDWTPNKKLTTSITPLTGKLTIVRDQSLANQGAYGVKAAYYTPDSIFVPGSKTRWEFGAKFNAKYENEIFENIKLSTKIIIFYDYLCFKNDKVYKCPIDFDWDGELIMRVNKLINCSISAHLIYDEDIASLLENGSHLQFKEVLSVGFEYKIP